MSRGKNEKILHIPDTPENVAKSIMKGPPKKDWDYLKRENDRQKPKSRSNKKD